MERIKVALTAYKRALCFCRLLLQMLELFKAGWIQIGCIDF